MSTIVIISVISLILDLVLSNFLPYIPGGLSLFTTSFSIITIFLIYPLFNSENKNYFIYSFIFGFIYDLALTNLFLYDAIVFLFIAYISSVIYKNFEIDFIKNIINIILVIIIYESLFAILIIIFNLIPININKIVYKILHTLISNIIYGEIIYFIINYISKKYGKKKINRLKV